MLSPPLLIALTVVAEEGAMDQDRAFCNVEGAKAPLLELEDGAKLVLWLLMIALLINAAEKMKHCGAEKAFMVGCNSLLVYRVKDFGI